MSRPLITEKDVIAAARSGKCELEIPPDALFTPLARDAAKSLGVAFIEKSNNPALLPAPDLLTIALGCDHSGIEAKLELKKMLTEKNYRLLDVGTDSNASCDYPDFAFKVGEALKNGRVAFGIMIDGVGAASAVVMNKIPTVRAANCCSELTAKIARLHGDANALSLGARILGLEAMKSIVLTFLSTPYEGGRHDARLEKIKAIERQFSRS
jgi:ribose 5-phosphate isomerase B